MAHWFVKNLGDALLASEQQESIKQQLLSALARHQGPDPLAAFIRHESEGRLHCEVLVYFAPGAASLARQFSARPCNRPSADGLSLLAGAPQAWPILFPGTDR